MDDLYKRVKPTEGPTPRLYGLPKVHKPQVPLRPIVASTTAPNYQLAKYLFSLLRPTLPEDNYDTKSSIAFFETNKKLQN